MIENLKKIWETAQPEFFRRMKPSYRAATLILAFVVIWIASGAIFGNHAGPNGAQAKITETPRVQVQTLDATRRDATLTIRGRTQALHAVDVRAEVEGVVKAIHFDKGDRVKQGDTLCELKVNDRGAKVDEARALVSQREKEFSAASSLAKNGYVSETQAKQARAALEAAEAQQRSMDIDLANTRIKAPFDGIVDDRYVDEGDYMRVGDKCELVIAPEPFLAVGTVSEQDVSKIKDGQPADAKLVTGETVQGKVRFVASRADATTRTFRVEVELPNPDGKLRDGVSADIHIPVSQVLAQRISSGILVLDDNGVYGVRIVENGIVHFKAVNIVSDGVGGNIWVTGLPDHVTVITIGQQFVDDGSRVIAVPQRGHG
ncbi:MAG: efflux RND transporter periplasmic adaptor subunit [Rhizomicrobium sp.]